MRKPKTKREWELCRAILETEIGLTKIRESKNI
jgi:hypothetical protein